MSEETEPTFQVDVSSRPIRVHICGRANFLNCSPLRTFFRKMVSEGNKEFSLDFTDCKGMDSTFLGILAGVAIDSQRSEPQGLVTLTGLGERNLELVKNLGLHRLVEIVENVENGSQGASEVSADSEGLSKEDQTEAEKKEMLIKAHEDLVKIDDSNLAKFQDLLTFLKNEE